MFVGSMFVGDDDENVMVIQHAEYGYAVGRILQRTQQRYLLAAAILGVEDEMTEPLRRISSFDHRVLQDAHDLIAAGFRAHLPRISQLELGEEKADLQDRIRQRWLDWLEAELGELVDNPEFVRAACEAVVMSNTPTGLRAERRLGVLLRSRLPPGAQPLRRPTTS